MVAALAIYKLLISKKPVYVNQSVVNQLIRSSSSMAANYRSATRAGPMLNSILRFVSLLKNVMKPNSGWISWSGRIFLRELKRMKYMLK